jgi:hypothetical protein
LYKTKTLSYAKLFLLTGEELLRVVIYDRRRLSVTSHQPASR